jgi:hypothetical protein
VKVHAACDAPGCEVEQTWEGANNASCLVLVRTAGWSVTGRKCLCPTHNKPKPKPKRPKMKHPKLEDTRVLVKPGSNGELAYTLKCPQCKAPPGHVCLRRPSERELDLTRHSPQYLIMDRPHNERYRAVYRGYKRPSPLQMRMERTVLERERARRARERWELARPLREFDDRETQQLREWLRLYGALFTDGD